MKLLLTVCFFITFSCFGESFFESYLNEPSPALDYEVVNSKELDFGSAHYLKMSSLVWDKSQVAPNVWKHWLGIVVPKVVKHDTALFIIDGGSYKEDDPKFDEKLLQIVSYLTSRLQAPIVYFRGTPMQPLKFSDVESKKVEDQIIAYTFNQFLETGDPSWPLLLPMVKSTTLAMDVAQSFLANHKIKTFILSGASKRGWTTWLTGAFDRRVVGIAPVVFDMLDFKSQLRLQKSSYGSYSESLKDYSDYGLQEKLASHPKSHDLLQLVDPINYLDKLYMPKLLILASGDSYWTVDSANLYWDHLIGNKNLLYIPNAGHSLDNKEIDVLSSLFEFSYNLMNERPLPYLNWTMNKNGKFHVGFHPINRPIKATLWHAQSERRDFRVITFGRNWQATPLPLDINSVSGEVKVSPFYYDAFFIEFEFPSLIVPFTTYKLTTQIFVNEKDNLIRQ